VHEPCSIPSKESADKADAERSRKEGLERQTLSCAASAGDKWGERCVMCVVCSWLIGSV
jgi:hypothetical protein